MPSGRSIGNLSSPVILQVLLLTFSLLHQQCLTCFLKSSEEKYRVIRRTDSAERGAGGGGAGHLVVAVGEDARLSCTVNVPWKNCTWKPPRNGVRELRCDFDRTRVDQWTCPSFPEVHYDEAASDFETCAIVVTNIKQYHEGNWRCEFAVQVPEQEAAIIVGDKVKLTARGWRYH